MGRAAFTIYLIILILSTLLFGAVHTYAYTLMALGVLCATFLLVIKNIGKDSVQGRYRFRVPRTSLNPAFLMLIGFLIFQTIPWSDSYLAFLSPEAKTVGTYSLPATDLVDQGNSIKDWFPLAPYLYPVRMSLIRFAVYGLLFLGLTQVLTSRKRIELAIFLILITGCFETLYGLFQAYSGSGHILWVARTFNRRDVAGTYLNRNHFAGLMEMGLLLAAAFSMALSKRKERKLPSVRNRQSNFRAKLLRFLSLEQRFNKRTLILFAGVMMGIGLIFSASRGGMLAAAFALLCLSLFFVFRKNYRRKGFALLLLFLITGGYALNIGVEYPLSRFKIVDKPFETRSRYTRKTLDMFKDYRLAGIGVGNFAYAYPRYQSAKDQKQFLRFGHNDWAQFMAEGGIAGLGLLLAGVVYYIYRTIRLWKRRSDPFAVCLGIMPLAVIVSMAFHSIWDFNLHIPANALMLAAIMAVGNGALHLRRHGGADTTLYRYHVLPLKYKGLLLLSLVLGLLGWTAFWTIRHFVAEVYCNTVPNSTFNRDQHPPLKEIQTAIFWDPTNAHYRYKLALERIRIRNSQIGRLSKTQNRQNLMKIIQALETAVALNPFRADYHLRLGWQYTYLWQEADYHRKWLPAADVSMHRAAYFAGVKTPRLHVDLGHYWTMRSASLGPHHPERPAAWSRAYRHYRQALSLETGPSAKRIQKEINEYVKNFYPDKPIGWGDLLTGTSQMKH